MRKIKMWFRWFWNCFIGNGMFKDDRGEHDYCKYCNVYMNGTCQGVRNL